MAGKPVASGGKRVRGRKPNSRVVSPIIKTNAAAVRILAEKGLLPLDVMVEDMRFHFGAYQIEMKKGAKAKDQVIRDELKLAREAAQAAAPYLHPRLQAVEHSGNLRVSLEDALEHLQKRGAA